ncbi:MAG: Oxidoreductase FAD-binding region [Ramlibacter sp.]|nr:Oxidoreductase FAD-binding region [Ramlibacter sp.]
MNAGASLVRIAGGDTSFPCASDDTLLRAAQRAGLGFPYECNVGSCGNCRFELLEGEVEVLWPQAPGLSAKDQQRRRYLGCQSQPRGDCSIKLRLDVRYAPAHPPHRFGAVLESSRALTHDMSEFRFVLDAPREFEPGQYALAYLPGVTGGRAYSMSNTAGNGRVWEFVVRRQPGGEGTRTLFDQLPAGTRITIDGPYGMAWLRRDAARDILCMAGGSGLAPMLSIARGAMAEPRLAGRNLHFLYGGRTPADVCGEEILRELPGWGERLHYHPAISPVPGANTQGWPGAVIWYSGLPMRLPIRSFGSLMPAFAFT